MGCDIHMHIERRENGRWEKVDVPVYDGRNYSLFAMLADVRNGSGFAGIDTGNPVTPIDQPRGLPDDVSEAVKAESDSWDVDGHSHSWFTLDELLRVDWQGNKITHRSQIRRKRGLPPMRGWSDDEYAVEIEKVFNSYGGNIWDLQGGWNFEMCGWSSEGHEGGWREIEWTESWATSVNHGWLTLLISLYSLGDPKDTRIVFFFDN